MVTVVVMAALLFAVFWSVGRCKAEGCHAHFQKEPLPFSLGSMPDAQDCLAPLCLIWSHWLTSGLLRLW
ncbi:unnamed protein product [Gadus morhua 'NCC']